MNWHNISINDTLEKLNTNAKNGLDTIEAKKRLEKYGKNLINEKKGKPFILRFIQQFSDFMIIFAPLIIY